MKDYLIIVEESGLSSVPKLSFRTIGKSEDYSNGIVKGLKIAYPDNEVYKEEIKN